MAINLTLFTKNILSKYADCTKISDWAIESIAFCCRENIIDVGEIEINPKKAVTRAEIAAMLYNMLRKAALI